MSRIWPILTILIGSQSWREIRGLYFISAEIQKMMRTSFFFSPIPTTRPSTQVQTCLLELFVSAIDLRQSFAQRGFSWAFSWYSLSHHKTWLIAIKPPNLFEIRKIDRSVLRMGKKIRGEQMSLEIGNWMKFDAGLYFWLQKHYFISISTTRIWSQDLLDISKPHFDQISVLSPIYALKLIVKDDRMKILAFVSQWSVEWWWDGL
jgi:hypothetical protein